MKWTSDIENPVLLKQLWNTVLVSSCANLTFGRETSDVFRNRIIIKTLKIAGWLGYQNASWICPHFEHQHCLLSQNIHEPPWRGLLIPAILNVLFMVMILEMLDSISYIYLIYFLYLRLLRCGFYTYTHAHTQTHTVWNGTYVCLCVCVDLDIFSI